MGGDLSGGRLGQNAGRGVNNFTGVLSVKPWKPYYLRKLEEKTLAPMEMVFRSQRDLSHTQSHGGDSVLE